MQCTNGANGEAPYVRIEKVSNFSVVGHYVMDGMKSLPFIHSTPPYESLLCCSVCDGIADLSRVEEAENFKKLVSDYVREIGKLNEERKPVYGVFQYTNLF